MSKPNKAHLLTSSFTASNVGESDEVLSVRYNQDGFLYFPKLAESVELVEIRQQILSILSDYVTWDHDIAKPISKGIGFYETDAIFDAIYPKIQTLESFHRFFHSPQIVNLMFRILGDKPFIYPMKMARVSTPNMLGYETPPHQDAHSHQSGESMAGIWIALHDIDDQMGRLQLLNGSHKKGKRPVTTAQGVGGVQCELYPEDTEWQVNNLNAGDVIIFHSCCVHRAEPNRSLDSVRLSIDTRFCCYGEPVFSSNLYPHHGWRIPNLDWQSIYQRWIQKDLTYYWLDYPSIHGPSENEWKDFYLKLS